MEKFTIIYKDNSPVVIDIPDNIDRQFEWYWKKFEQNPEAEKDTYTEILLRLWYSIKWFMIEHRELSRIPFFTKLTENPPDDVRPILFRVQEKNNDEKVAYLGNWDIKRVVNRDVYTFITDDGTAFSEEQVVDWAYLPYE